MIYLELFLTFLEVGAFSFGGGYAMISIIRDKVLNMGWLTDGELLNMIAVSESTPGPIAVNMATFVGSKVGGVFGSFVATLGVVLPSFIVILIIAAVLKNILKYKPVQAVLSGIRPCIPALILSTAITMLLGSLLDFKTVTSGIAPDFKGIFILGIIAATAIVCKKAFGKNVPPILMIVISAGLGMMVYSF